MSIPAFVFATGYFLYGVVHGFWVMNLVILGKELRLRSWVWNGGGWKDDVGWD